jgi:hypothetical protein
MKKNKLNENCTAQTTGSVKSVKTKGQDFPTIITVTYDVNGYSYEVSESIKLKSEPIKLGFLTVGQKRVLQLGNTSVGSAVRVMYNPNNPGEAFLPDNTGIANV